MALGKQAKILSSKQTQLLMSYVSGLRNGIRNSAIVLLSAKAGLRAKEIAELRWEMLLNPDKTLGDAIHLTDTASKGRSGRTIPLNKQLKAALKDLHQQQQKNGSFAAAAKVIQTERSDHTSPQAIVNMFSRWYSDLSFVGCSSHSGRRTFVTTAAKKATTVGGSLRDVQMLAGHASLQTTQRYIEADTDAQRRLVQLV
jgi:integrase/recombinase XerD